MDTEDLVQEAFLGLLPRMHRIESRRRKAVRAYLRRAIKNRVIDEVRRAGKVEVPASEGLVAPDDRPSPFAAAAAADRQRLFRQGLAKLRPTDQELVVGRVVLQYSYEQLALACGRPNAHAARIAVARAIERLAHEIPAA